MGILTRVVLYEKKLSTGGQEGLLVAFDVSLLCAGTAVIHFHKDGVTLADSIPPRVLAASPSFRFGAVPPSQRWAQPMGDGRFQMLTPPGRSGRLSECCLARLAEGATARRGDAVWASPSRL